MAPAPVVHDEEKLEDNQDVRRKGMETALATAVNSTPAQGMDATEDDRGQDNSSKLSALDTGKMINSNATEGDNSTAIMLLAS
jgi:hypothetical protein